MSTCRHDLLRWFGTSNVEIQLVNVIGYVYSFDTQVLYIREVETRNEKVMTHELPDGLTEERETSQHSLYVPYGSPANMLGLGV